MPPQMGKLYLCPSPIGNLDDITLRVLKTLEDADVIYCEDTRHSRRLLTHYQIQKPLKAFHAHNEVQAGQALAEDIQAGLQVALLSDAGMPGISDPGAVAVRLAQDYDLPYTVLPGPSASLTALVLSGFASERFIFEGFLPRKGKDREKRLKKLDRQTATAIIYESPHRILATLEEFSLRWPDRQGALCREISKVYEDVQRGTFSDLFGHYKAHPPKGEMVLIIEGFRGEDEGVPFADALQLARQGLAQGLGLNQAAKEAAQATGHKKRDLYQALLEEKDGT